MSDALSDIARDERKNKILHKIKSLIEEGKNENDKEVSDLIEDACNIPRGYWTGRIKQDDIIKWIKKGCPE